MGWPRGRSTLRPYENAQDERKGDPAPRGALLERSVAGILSAKGSDMKVLIQLRPLTLPEVTPAQLEEIRGASGGAEVVVVSNDEDSERHLPEAEVVLGMIERRDFAKAEKLRWIQAVVSGVDMLLYPEMVESDVILTGEKGLVGEHLADHAFALLLALTRQLKRAVLEAPNSWPSRLSMRRQMLELSGHTMGVVGLGGTGLAVAKRARAFGMDVIAVDPEPLPRPAEVSELWGTDRFHELLARSDVVAVCCPLTKATTGMFDDRAFAAMKDGAYIVNVTRGPIIDGEAIVRALRSGRLAGAGLDVTPQEPLPADNPLWQMPNVVITPHTAGASPMRAGRNVARFVENLRRYRAGQPLDGLIDKHKGY
jgi:phosphoglycerate dehydrogenase-like enzyme